MLNQLCTPFPTHLKMSSTQCPSSAEEKANHVSSPIFIASRVPHVCHGIYQCSDIAQAVGAVSKYMANPGCDHWKVVKWILRYLRGTSGFCLCYSYDNLSCVGYVDSDFAGDLDKRRSTSGLVFTMAGGAISWESKLQSVVALSTTEAEYIASTHACKEAIWLKRLLGEFKLNQDQFSVYCDSQSALHLARNPAFHSRTKHIEVRYHFVRKVVEDGQILLHKISTKSNPADMLTKPVAKEKFTYCCTSLGLKAHFSWA
ncbi:hypothetical protein Syun_010395 [Stephania yunnanensis]|uniref:Retrovirus-related Pol polyprotein from transposon TNT 1-94 n=1 Tax=Stephania yunnanensis TaxID=152371 RepID=A0AAP0KGF7_9MAGN